MQTCRHSGSTPALTVATILSITCWPKAGVTGEKGKGERVNTNAISVRLTLSLTPERMDVVTSDTFIILSTSTLPFPLLPCSPFLRFLERLCKPEVHLGSLQAINRGRAVEI